MAAVICDFVQDYYERYLWPKAEEFGLTARPQTDMEWRSLHRDVLWIATKKLPTLPRKIKVANDFRCPRHLEAGLRAFRQKVLRGESLNPHLSRRSDVASHRDGLLSDWGIRHFHLGTRPHEAARAYVERTSDLLFAWVNNGFVHDIAIGDHSNFENFELVETLYRNWPELLEPYEMPSLFAGGRRPAADELRRARGRLFLPVEIDGRVFAPPGGGVATDGTSMSVAAAARRQTELLCSFEKWVNENAVEAFRSQGLTVSAPLELKLELGPNGAYAFAEALHARLSLPQ